MKLSHHRPWWSPLVAYRRHVILLLSRYQESIEGSYFLSDLRRVFEKLNREIKRSRRSEGEEEVDNGRKACFDNSADAYWIKGDRM